MNGTWYNLPNLNLLWLIPLAGLILIWAEYMRRRTLSRMISANLRDKLIASLNRSARLAKALLLLGSLVFLVLALARPAWNQIPQDVRRNGRDVIFLLDVSRSMLADDLKPNRLERAKIAISDCVDVLEGDRVALAVFAGGTVVKCPLTLDYGFFRMMLTDVNCNSVTRGGTLIGDALRKISKEVFDAQLRQYKDIVLITDGEDHESFPVEAAKAIGAEGVRLIAVGLGDEGNGAPIIVQDENGRKSVLKYQGEVVRSKLDSSTLRQMVAETPGGRYLPVSTGNFDLGQVYRDLIANAERREIDSQTLPRYEEKFQIFLGLAMILLFFSMMISERRKTMKANAPLAVLVLFLIFPSLLKAEDSTPAVESPYLLFNSGLEKYANQDFDNASEDFQGCWGQSANFKRPDHELEAKAQLAQGNTAYRQALKALESGDAKTAKTNLETAIDAYGRAHSINPSLDVAQKNRTVARLTHKRLQKAMLEQQKQQQQQQQQAQEQQKQLEQLAQQQQNAADNSRQADKNQADQQQAMQDNQQELNNQTDDLAKKMQENQTSQSASEKVEDAKQEQAKAQQSLENQDYEDAAAHQEKASQALKEAAKEIEKQQQQQQAQKQDSEDKQQQQQAASPESSKQPQDQAEPQPQPASQQEEQPDQDSQDKQHVQLNTDARDILEDERRNQRKRQVQQSAIEEVDKDW